MAVNSAGVGREELRRVEHEATLRAELAALRAQLLAAERESAELQALRPEVERLRHLALRADEERAAVAAELGAARRELAVADYWLTDLKASTSWRATAPLRLLARVLRGAPKHQLPGR
jgi:hypothetical protein